MKLFATVFLLLISLNCWAQFQKFKLKPHQKQWEQGQLSWDDFLGKIPANANQNSELAFQLIYAPEKLKYADSIIFVNRVFGFADKKKSWVRESEKTPLLLQYNQAQFNLLEMHRRQLQQDLSGALRSRDAHWLTGKALFQLKDELAKLQQKSDFGQNPEIITAFLDSTNHVLQTKENAVKPAFEAGSFGVGTHSGFGYRTFTGDLGEHLTDSKGWEYNLAFAFKKSLLNLDFGLGFNEIKHGFTERPGWEAGKKTTMLQAGISYGYTVSDKNKLRITPFAGIAALGIQPREQFLNGINNTHAFYAGLSMDFKLRKRIWLIPSAINPKEIADYGLRAQLKIMPAQYNNSLKGSAICVTFAPYIFTRFIKSKKLY